MISSKAVCYGRCTFTFQNRQQNFVYESFEQIGEIIADVVKKYDNVTCISGRNFVPEDETLFSDLYLHPNDAGFRCYSESVKKAVEAK